jgi:predicted ATP-grasp superfamily ATP-dependent carboligase
LSGATQELLLQEYVAGDDSDIVVCGCYIGRSGELLGHFTGRKLKQNPPLVGTGSVVEAAEIVPILDVSVALLKAFRYSGLAEIEFKYDRTADRFCLIEINPRHWDQHELGTLVGVNLSWIAYRDMVGLDVAPCRPAYRANSKYKWIAEQELLEDVAHNFSLRALGKAMREWAFLLRGRKIFGVTKLHDPLPGALMWLRLLAHGLKYFGRARVRPALAEFRERKAGE